MCTGVKVLFTWAMIVNHVYGNNSNVVSTGVKVLFTWAIIANHLCYNSQSPVWEQLLCSVHWSQSIIYLGYNSQQPPPVWEQLFVVSTEVKVLFNWVMSNTCMGTLCCVYLSQLLFNWVIIANHPYGNITYVVSARVKVTFTLAMIVNHL